MNMGWVKSNKTLSFFLSVLLLVSILSASNSLILSWTLNHWLKKQASDVSMQDLKISLFNSELQIEGLSAKDINGHQISFDSLNVSWVFSDLWDKRISIEQVSIDGLHIDVRGNAYKPEYLGPIDLIALFESNRVDANTNHQVSKEQNLSEQSSWRFTIGPIEITNSEVCYQDKTVDYSSMGFPVSFTSKKLDLCSSWDSIHLNSKPVIEPSTSFEYTADFKLDKFKINDSLNNQLLAFTDLRLMQISIRPTGLFIDKVMINDFSLLAQNNQHDFSDIGLRLSDLTLDKLSIETESMLGMFEQLDMSSIVVNQRLGKNVIKPVIDVSNINIAKFTLSEQSLDLGSIMLKRLIGHITLDEQGSNLQRLQKSLIPKNTTGEATENIPKNNEPFIVNVDSISIGDESSIVFVDQLYENSVEHNITDIKLSIKNIHLGDKSSDKSTIDLSAKIEGSGILETGGSFVITDESIALNVKGILNHIDLVKLTNHSAKFINYRIEQGLVNVDYDVKLEKNNINANFDVFLEKFNLGKLQEHEKSVANDELGMPLPLALNLLRDSDKNINLTLPVTGDISAPDFSLSNVFSIVTMKAIKNAVLYYYSPLGLFDIASGIVNLATALKFDPIIFQAGSIELSQQAKLQLEKVSKLMIEKTSVKFVICADATINDLELNSKDKDSKNELITESNFDPKPLIILANKRQKLIIDYLTRDGVIDASRLIGCNVKLNKKPTAKSLVNISI